MIALDRKLLLRVAQRTERLAKERYDEAVKADPARAESARRTRDSELGDASDLKDYIKRVETDSENAARYVWLRASGADVDFNALLRDGGEEMDRNVDAAIAKAPAAKLGREA